MVKVECIVCGDTGYTASPDYLICKCGGKFKVVPENGKREKVELDNDIPQNCGLCQLFRFCSLINPKLICPWLAK